LQEITASTGLPEKRSHSPCPDKGDCDEARGMHTS